MGVGLIFQYLVIFFSKTAKIIALSLYLYMENVSRCLHPYMGPRCRDVQLDQSKTFYISTWTLHVIT